MSYQTKIIAKRGKKKPPKVYECAVITFYSVRYMFLYEYIYKNVNFMNSNNHSNSFHGGLAVL